MLDKLILFFFFFFSSRRRHTRFDCDWSSDVCSSDLEAELVQVQTATRVQFLQAGKVDLLIASMELNPDRAETLGYAPTPFYRVGGIAAVRKGSGIARWEDLRGKPVCVSQGSSFAKPLASE